MTALSVLGPAVWFCALASAASSWPGWGNGLDNRRWAKGNTAIFAANVATLAQVCYKAHRIGVSANPVVHGSTAYYPTWDGTFHALDIPSCTYLWSTNITALIHAFAPVTALQAAHTKAISRTSPQLDVSSGALLLGTQTHALVVALDASTGEPLHVLQLVPHPYAIITMSPTLHDGKLFIGAASNEHLVATEPRYACCSFAGVMAALAFDRNSGFRVLWNVSTIAPSRQAEGWAGVSVWGSQPSVSVDLNAVFIGTGNAYKPSDETSRCQHANNLTAFVSNDPDPCMPDREAGHVWSDALVALDLDSGATKWVYQPVGVDAYSANCGYPGFGPVDEERCTWVPGPDHDFGMAPAFVAGAGPGRGGLLVAGRKSGHVHAVSAVDGSPVWVTRVGPPHIGGGVVWGVAVDDERVYYVSINGAKQNVTVGNSTTDRSVFGAVNLVDGRILWETKVPREGGVSYAPPSVVGDVVLVARTGQDVPGGEGFDRTKGGVVALHKATGKVITDFELSSNSHGGISVQERYILIGTGYNGFAPLALVDGGFHVLTVAKPCNHKSGDAS